MSRSSKRYQVFVSSTYEDLKEEREAVIKMIISLGCFPAAMEFFNSSHEEKWKYISSLIDESDFLVLLVAGRYGSMDPEGVSYTEKEYLYAVETGKPTLVFMLDDINSLPVEKRDTDPDRWMRLANFRNTLDESKIARRWRTCLELPAMLASALFPLTSSPNAIGWIRGDQANSIESMQEIIRLRDRIDELEVLIEQSTSDDKYASFAQRDESLTIRYNAFFYISTKDGKTSKDTVNRAGSFATTWGDVIGFVLSRIEGFTTDHEIAKYVSTFVSIHGKVFEVAGSSLPELNSPDDPFYDEVRWYSYDREKLYIKDDFPITLRVQMMALGLLERGDDSRTYFPTSRAERVLIETRAVKASATAPNNASEHNEILSAEDNLELSP